jgi:molybdenum cofactor sulfurtransferase
VSIELTDIPAAVANHLDTNVTTTISTISTITPRQSQQDALTPGQDRAFTGHSGHPAPRGNAGRTGILSRRVIYELGGLGGAEADFKHRFPEFDPDGALAELRRSEYGRLDDDDHVYLDYTGGGLHAASQIDAHIELLRTRVLGNPHSNSPASLASTDLVERARGHVRRFFNAPEDDYLCVFTANASSALRLVGESYRFAPGGTFALTADNHNSVNGIREFARRKGAQVAYVPVTAPELRVDRAAMTRVLRAAAPGAHNLVAFPAQSNFSGVQHGLDIVDVAHGAGWDVLVDVSAFAPTNRFDVSRARPDFAALSFYKMMGFPTGLGCLLMRRDRFDALSRPWFAGGTITIASVLGNGHYLRRDEGAFEDGTVDYLNLPAVTIGLRYLEGVGLDTIHRRVGCLTSWLLDALGGLCHEDGRRLVHIHGPRTIRDRGGTVAFSMHDRDGTPIDDLRVEELANRANISLRTGCFCNPGAGEAAHQLDAEQMAKWFGRVEPVSYPAFREGIQYQYGRLPSAIRISVGVATTFADVYRFLCFLQKFVDRSTPLIDHPEFAIHFPLPRSQNSCPTPMNPGD